MKHVVDTPGQHCTARCAGGYSGTGGKKTSTFPNHQQWNCICREWLSFLILKTYNCLGYPVLKMLPLRFHTPFAVVKRCLGYYFGYAIAFSCPVAPSLNHSSSIYSFHRRKISEGLFKSWKSHFFSFESMNQLFKAITCWFSYQIPQMEATFCPPPERRFLCDGIGEFRGSSPQCTAVTWIRNTGWNRMEDIEVATKLAPNRSL